jgi:hypothetical protein
MGRGKLNSKRCLHLETLESRRLLTVVAGSTSEFDELEFLVSVDTNSQFAEAEGEHGSHDDDHADDHADDHDDDHDDGHDDGHDDDHADGHDDDHDADGHDDDHDDGHDDDHADGHDDDHDDGHDDDHTDGHDDDHDDDHGDGHDDGHAERREEEFEDDHERRDRQRRRHGGNHRNPIDPLDVSNDNVISPVDALVVINDLNRDGSRELILDTAITQLVDESMVADAGDINFVDVNDDMFVTSLDALNVINALNFADVVIARGHVTDLFGHLRGSSNTVGKVEYEVEREDGVIKREFEVEIQGAQPLSVYPVVVGGLVVGQLQVDGFGRGELKLTNHAEESDESEFPADFPLVTVMTQVSVGDLVTGELSIRDRLESESDDYEIPFESPHDSHQEQEIKAYLFGDSFAFGTAKFEAEQEDVGTKYEFKIKVEQASPGTMDVLVDSVLVGQVTSDSRGRGELKFSNEPGEHNAFPVNFPTITPGTIVQVGNGLFGTFNGTLQMPTAIENLPLSETPDSNSHDDFSDDEFEVSDDFSDEVPHLESYLSGVNGVRGKASFEVEFDDGSYKAELDIRVRDGQPLSTYDFHVDGLFVGTVSLDAQGRGRVSFSSMPEPDESLLPIDSLSIKVGTTVSVGDILTGSFHLDD